MTRPVQSCATNIDYCSVADRTVHDALAENHRRHGGTGAAKNVTPNGDTRREVKLREDGAVGGGKQFARKLGEHIRDNKYKEEPRAQFIEKMVEKFGGLPGKILSGVKHVSEFHQLATDWARETAAKQDIALQRDAMNLLVIDLVQLELPEGYVAAARANRAEANALYADLLKAYGNLPAERLQATQREVLASAKAGIAAAKGAGIDSAARLEQERVHNPQFAQRYARETAFRHGVQSVLFEAGK